MTTLTVCTAVVLAVSGQLTLVTAPEGAPKASDVIMRSLRVHPAGENDPYDTLQAIRDFHVTRLEWTYVDNAAFIQQVKGLGCLFGGAIAAPSYFNPDRPADWLEQVCILNLEGDIIIAPWKRNWKPTLWGCVNNPELERGYLAYLKRYIDAGAEVMQRDEPGGNLGATYWGGCFCEHCTAKFRAWLAERVPEEELRKLGVEDVATFDYRKHLIGQGAPVGDDFRNWDGGELKKLFVAFQTEATVAFHERSRKAIDAYAGRHVPFSCNNDSRRWGETELVFDWAFGELSYGHATAAQIYNIIREALEHGRMQVVTMPKSTKWETAPDMERRTRQTIAMAYACGGHCMAPWDTYMPGDTPRYFGKAEQYADLFGFIRGNARYLDGYVEFDAWGKGFKESESADFVEAPECEHVCAVARRAPGDDKGPRVIHLVDWSNEPKPFAVKVKVEPAMRLVGAVLRVPVPYDLAAHDKARESGDFEPLVKEVALEAGDDGRIEIPALSPWGIVVLSEESTMGEPGS